MAYCRKLGLAGVGDVDVTDDEGAVSAMCSSRLCGKEEPDEGIVCDEITSLRRLSFPSTLTSDSARQISSMLTK